MRQVCFPGLAVLTLRAPSRRRMWLVVCDAYAVRAEDKCRLSNGQTGARRPFSGRLSGGG